MKIPVPTLTRQLILARVIVVQAASKELMSNTRARLIDDAMLKKNLERLGITATLDEYRLLIKSLTEILSVDLVGRLTSEVAGEPIDGLSAERELELLKEITRKLVGNFARRSDPSKILALFKKNGIFAAVEMTTEELAFVAITAMNEHAARFQAEVEAALK